MQKQDGKYIGLIDKIKTYIEEYKESHPSNLPSYDLYKNKLLVWAKGDKQLRRDYMNYLNRFFTQSKQDGSKYLERVGAYIDVVKK